MIPRAAARGRDRAVNCAVVLMDFLGATIGTDREVEPAVVVGRPDVIAEPRRAPSSQLRTNITHRQGGGQPNAATAALDWSGVG